MVRKYNPALKSSLDATADKQGWSTSLVNGLGTTRTIKIYHDPAGGADPSISGTLVYSIGASGALTMTGANITGHGTLSGTTVRNIPNLSVGTACLRIEGSNGNYIQGSLSVNGNTDFVLSANPSTNGSISLKNMVLQPPTNLPLLDGSVSNGSAFTTVAFENTSASALTNVPVTFGHPFKALELPASGAAVALKLADNSIVPAQLDIKSTHADGSVRHAVISAILPAMSASEVKTASLIRTTASAATPAVPSEFTGLNASVSLTIAGTVYTASLTDVLTTNSPKWLSGNVCTEWIVPVPFKTAGNVTHPLLHARFYVRGYKGQNKAKIDVSVENTWVKLANSPTSGQNGILDNSMAVVTADVAITVGGTQVYTESAVKHYAYSRWKNTYWWNTATPPINVKTNTAYIIGTQAVPNYDTSLTPSTTRISDNVTTMNNRLNLMSLGMMTMADMGATGGRSELGLLPGWDVITLLGQNKDAKKVTAFAGDRAGVWSAHFRNYGTDKPLNMNDAPYFGVITGGSSDAQDPATGIRWDAPPVTGTNDYSWELAHHPDPNFVPYLLTGDMYYAEGLEFWAHSVLYHKNPGYRQGPQGIVMSEGQTRAVAWALRTLIHAAYLLPDSAASKASLNTVVQNNITYSVNRFPNSGQNVLAALGVIDHYIEYPAYSTHSGSGSSEPIATPPWQQDFMTSAIGRAVELGFPAQSLFTFNSKFVVNRLTSGANFCYIFASSYALAVKDTAANGGAYYTTMAQVYQGSTSATMRGFACGSQALADYLKANGNPNTTQAGQLIAESSGGALDNANLMQPAVAYAKAFGVTNGANAWTVYTSDPNYRPATVTSDPQFSILPR